MGALTGKTYIVTGSTRGIGKAIALKLAADGANVVIAAKTVESGPRTPGTIFDGAKAVDEAGGVGMPFQLDVRDDENIQKMVAATVERFGGVDGLVNNASAIMLLPCGKLPMKRYDLIMDINVRGSFACAQAVLPFVTQSTNGHILTLSPPIDLDPKWFGGHVGYTMSKYGMSMLTIGLAEEMRGKAAANSLWPRTTIATAAVNWIGGAAMMDVSRTPAIMADAAHAILTSPQAECTGNHFIDEDVLRSRGVSDFSGYAHKPGTTEFAPDLFVPGYGGGLG